MARQLVRRTKPTGEDPVIELNGDEDVPRSQRAQNVESFVEGRKDANARPRRESVGSGWSSYRKHKTTSTDFPDEVKVTDEEILVKFIDDAPFVTYLEHWLNDAPTKKKSYICIGDDCPLCDMLGDSPSFRALFNVIELTGDKPGVKVWRASPNPAGEIEVRADNPKTSPINRTDLYFAVSKAKGRNGFFSYTVDPVKSRDLEDEWEVIPLTEPEIQALAEQAYTESIVVLPTRRELVELVNKIRDDE